MLNIAVCDDEAVQTEYLKERLLAWGAQSGRKVCARAFDSAESFLFAWEQDRGFDILLLDIQMKAMDGVSLARELRKQGDALQIVFITGYPDYIAEGYDVSALHYLIKPVADEKLFQVLDKAAERLQRASRSILFATGGGTARVRADDILYAEAFSHEIVLHTAREELRLSMRLSDLEKALGEGFFRCHRSYIVGMRHVRKVTRRAMALDGGREIPLSRALYDAANRMFIEST